MDLFLLDWIIDTIQNATLIELTLFSFVTLIYVILFSVLLLGTLLNPQTKPLITNSKPMVTVLVSARDEEDDIVGCIDSILSLNYPKEKLQIILVNDLSVDSTGDILDSYAKKNDHVLAIHTTNEPETHLKAKGRGIANGFKYASGDWVFITDADAKVHPDWISHSLEGVESKDGMLGGALMVKPNGIVGMIERISWAFLQQFNLGMAGLGLPFACVGPNMAIRRSIYVEAGGLENANFKIAEDLALFEMVLKAGYKVKTFFSAETMVELTPVPSFRHLISQQRRWFIGGIEQSIDYSIMLWLTISYGFIFGVYCLFGWILNLKLYIIFACTRIIFDFLNYTIQKRRLKLKHHYRYLVISQIYTSFIFIIVVPSFLFNKRIKWMGTNYSIDFN